MSSISCFLLGNVICFSPAIVVMEMVFVYRIFIYIFKCCLHYFSARVRSDIRDCEPPSSRTVLPFFHKSCTTVFDPKPLSKHVETWKQGYSLGFHKRSLFHLSTHSARTCTTNGCLFKRSFVTKNKCQAQIEIHKTF